MIYRKGVLVHSFVLPLCLKAYVKERIEHTKSEKEKDTLKNELIRIKKQVAVAEASMKNFEAEVIARALNHWLIAFTSIYSVRSVCTWMPHILGEQAQPHHH